MREEKKLDLPVGQRPQAADLPFLAALIAVFLLVPLFAWNAWAQTGGLSIVSGPSAVDVTETEATIRWQTDAVSTTVVHYGKTEAMTEPVQRKISPMDELETTETIHTMALWELTPGTTYYYQVSSVAEGGASAQSGIKTFATKAPAPTCTEDIWECGAWGACAKAGLQTRVCTLKTDCAGVQTPMPPQEQPCKPPVVPDPTKEDPPPPPPPPEPPKPPEPPPPPPCDRDVWECGAWGACSAESLQERTCTLKTDCAGVETPMPPVKQPCKPLTEPTKEEKPPEPPPPPPCDKDVWECGDWDACSADGKQTRTCELKTDCAGVETPKPETEQACTPEVTGSDNNPQGVLDFVASQGGYAVTNAPSGIGDATGADTKLTLAAPPSPRLADAIEAFAEARAPAAAQPAVQAGEPAPEAAVTLEQEPDEQLMASLCAAANIPMEKCRGWLTVKYANQECRDSGQATRESCVAHLSRKNNGVFPGCAGKTPKECVQLQGLATMGYLSDNARIKADEMVRLAVEDKNVISLPGVTAVSPELLPVAQWYPTTSAEGTAGAPAAIVLDSDKDGLPDDMEKSLGTDPLKADTDGDGVSDAEELRKGTDPKSAGTQGVALTGVFKAIVDGKPLELPNGENAGQIDDKLTISLASLGEPSTGGSAAKPQFSEDEAASGGGTKGSVGSGGTAAGGPAAKPQFSEDEAASGGGTKGSVGTGGTAAGGAGQAGTQFNEDEAAGGARGSVRGASGKGFALHGTGAPGQVYTLFISSYVPMVLTTTADASGNWSYDLSEGLTDGEHTVYVAVSDETGKVVTKSNPLSFVVQAAQALSPKDFLDAQAAVVVQNPVETKQRWYLWGVVALVLAGAAAAWVVTRRMRKASGA